MASIPNPTTYMFRVSATTDIDASPKQVWQVIADLANYHQWNSQLFYLGGQMQEGAKLHLKLVPKGQSGYEFKPEVIVLAENQEFAWVARTGFKGLFDGEHHFQLESLGESRTRLHNYEIYSGLLAPLMQRLPMMQGADEGFELMNAEIKQRAEALAQGRVGGN